MSQRIRVVCLSCKATVSSFGTEEWRACPKCHARGKLVTLEDAAIKLFDPPNEGTS